MSVTGMSDLKTPSSVFLAVGRFPGREMTEELARVPLCLRSPRQSLAAQALRSWEKGAALSGACLPAFAADTVRMSEFMGTHCQGISFSLPSPSHYSEAK